MFPKRRVLIPILVVFALLIWVVGCSKQEASPSGTAQGEFQLPDKIVIGWAPPDITGVFKTAQDYLERAAKDAQEKAGLNVEVITRAPSSHTDYAAQVAILENFIQRKVDAIVVSPIDIEPVKPVIKQANEAGIPVIVVNLLEPIEGIEVASYIGFDNEQAARVSAYAVLDYLGGPGVLGEGEKVEVSPETYLDEEWWKNLYKDVDPNSIKGKVAIIEGVAGDFFTNARTRGFKEVISKFPNVEIVSALPADWNREKAVKAAENILQNFKDLDVIWAQCAEMALGAKNAVQAANRQNEVAVFSNDGTPESVDEIRKGTIVAETWHGFPEWGWYGTKFAVMLKLGVPVPEIFDVRPRTEYKNNADMFYPNPKLEPIDWNKIIEEAKAAKAK
ncbi:sugar ABC transporter substrate-binding protein [Thermanaeromonas sp. C210]|uniref:sugar ABC transporter substrate-binding protein n=1 Tax=Thermanaeromonas sp. C210 TaxID=2731925 RepID=UPI00155C49E9|nr:sugar ABC transporter substrate-binding protein [Thermanaeromonas sp. C210]GFN22585.1 ABC transporter substrate-binding protein [Thermanaeromonas sp. C210]